MRYKILVLVLTAMMLVGSALPALASHNDSDSSNEPRAPRCGWYFFEETRRYDAWWEYWCYYRGWGWEFVFWVWA